MFLPAEYSWLEPVLIASGVVFLVSLLGNLLAFGNRLANAIITAIIFGLIFGAVMFYGYGEAEFSWEPSPDAPSEQLDRGSDTQTQ